MYGYILNNKGLSFLNHEIYKKPTTLPYFTILITDEHHNYDKHPNEVVKNEELTYNSGSGQESRCHFNAYVWILFWLGTWLPGRIEPHVWIAFGVVKTILNVLICAIGSSNHRSLQLNDI